MEERDQLAELSISLLFRKIIEASDAERISIADILDAMEERATAALVLLFALPNVLPTPPGTSTVLGLPLLILSFQLAIGWPVWLPGFITHRSVRRVDFMHMFAKAEPWLQRAERLLKPRFGFMLSYPAERAVGVLALVLAIVLVLPIPLGNMPPASALCIMALGLMAADGLFIMIGIVAGFLSLMIAGSVVLGLAAGAWFALRQVFA